ncbi:MAG: GYDIA family GHMP kinase [Leeuwenhoekiella sp.]
MTDKSFYSNGKLLLTGEYLVLDGAKALAVPTKKGQSLTVENISENGIFWSSLDEHKNCLFETKIDFKELKITRAEKTAKNSRERLIQILTAAQELNPHFLSKNEGLQVITELDFNREWGLGSSSTLINNIAQWAAIDPYKLLRKTFGGSGYDIACAQHDTAIHYQLKDESPVVEAISYNPGFADQLYFIHLNQKQNSRDAIKNYRNQSQLHLKSNIEEISQITAEIIRVNSLIDFNRLITTHENILSKLLNLPTVKDRLFSDFKGGIKSLGGWGGDFILATGTQNDMQYFSAKGFETIVPFKQMVL